VATLDLHGQTVGQARLAVVNFLETWRRREPGGLVHIVTGKGRGSSGAPVLRGAVKRLLTTTLAHAVQEFDLDLEEGGYLVRLSG
jgi:DNA-nicking Smr family endonuclease